MRLSLVQFNPMVGDVRGNAERLARWADDAASRARDPGLTVFPELALVGYPPRDLLLQEGFLEAVRDEVARLCTVLPQGEMVMVGAPWRPPVGAGGAPTDAWDPHAPVTNSILCIRAGRVEARYDKRLLPTYDVFDEDRYFVPGSRAVTVSVAGVAVGVSICEDLWRGDDARASARYRDEPDPVVELVRAGAQLIVNPSASPFALGKGPRQRDILKRHVRSHGVAVAAVNQVGGNDDLIFDGHAAVYLPGPGPGAEPVLVAAGPGFQESIVHHDLGDGRGAPRPVADPLLDAPPMSLLWRALVLGVRDYCTKTGFKEAVLGLSGGIDSALVAAVAVAALGRDKVTGVLMPSRYSSAGSVTDALALARNLGLRAVKVPIEPAHAVLETSLSALFDQLGVRGPEGITEENIQSRLRGVILMAVSNKTGAILLTTGNKSELAVGYCTLYGDMNGGLAVLSDVTKVQVYELARWLNVNETACGFSAGLGPIPESSISKPPSAELRPNQTDQDSLPPYEVLDEIVERYVEGHQSASRIARESGISPETVRRVVRLIDVNEYKRKQTPVGLRVTDKSFGPGRRQPIAQGWRAEIS
ncbi:MAG: NAD+ synthase [Phycisphaerales bacterium]